MKAIFEIDFDMEMMFDKESLEEDFDGDYTAAMQWLFKEEGFGIFDKELRLTKINN